MTAQILAFPQPGVPPKILDELDALGVQVTTARLALAEYRVHAEGDGWLVSIPRDVCPFTRDLALAKAVGEIFDLQEAERA